MGRKVQGPWYRASKGTWYATAEGGRKVSLGVKGEAKKAEAVRAWHRFMGEEPKPKPIEPKAEPKTEAVTVQAVVVAFLADAVLRLKASTIAIYRQDLEGFAVALGKRNADALSPQLLTAWLAGLKVGSTTKAIRLRSVSACLGWAVRNDLMPFNPAVKVPKPKCRSRSAEAVITEADHLKLLASATPDFRLVLQVLHATGCRPGEAGKMTVETFDPNNGVVKLAEHKTDATGKPRVIFLTPELVTLLSVQAARFKHGALLRNRNGTPWNGPAITQAMQRAKKKAGVKGMAYGYRHGFATAALSSGVPDAHVAVLLGHSSTAMLHKHYSHLTSQAEVLRGSLAKVRVKSCELV